MKILAVIPARAGSKGIPNKNIRLIAGHPMVYYAIRNAKRSREITDVIVTTDCPVVEIIARELNAAVKQRDAALCGDAVTLDAVVADAIPQGTAWDYIVTMQPTSPTLCPETLDKAIQYAIVHDLDTLISVVNAPHLSWGERDGKKVPNYEKRLNRQYLPPCYMETGAFVISKASVVTKQTRIGKKVDVYEVSDDEAQDVDTFSDLRNVSDILERSRVAIYVNGNHTLGLGHIYRALELADEFYALPDILYDARQTDLTAFGDTTHRLHPVDGLEGLLECCRKEHYTLFINDILDTSVEYMSALRVALPDARIINFEDDGPGAAMSDLVFNALYTSGRLPNMQTGERYYIPGKLFLLYRPIRIREAVERVLICFGGADPQNYTERLLKIAEKPEYSRFQFTVVLGRAKKNVRALMDYNSRANFTVMYDAPNMAELMSRSDIAVTSRGRTGYELALMGVPTITLAQNAREEKHAFLCRENGFTYLGLNPTDEVIEGNLRILLSSSQESRLRDHCEMLRHDLRNGRKHVMNMIYSL